MVGCSSGVVVVFDDDVVVDLLCDSGCVYWFFGVKGVGKCGIGVD